MWDNIPGEVPSAMGSLSVSGLEELLRAQDCIVLMCAGKIVCGCSKEFGDLTSLADHLAKAHSRRPKKEVGEEEPGVQGLQEHFRRNFTFPPENENAVTVTLPEDITCVCLGEHDIGAFAADIKCHICHKLCEDLDSLNKHIASVHRMFHRLVGHNITFEKPDASHVKPAFYCPMIKCKYHVAESFQSKYFKTFKLLKQHYVKVHASKEFHCSKCEQKFASKTYLDIHSKNCGEEFGCQDCDSKFSSMESAQTHCRRKGHAMIPSQKPAKSPKARDPARDKLTILQSYPGPGRVPIAPRPSTMHINAAIALSELSATQLYTPRADIGVQTDVGIWRHRKSATPASCEPSLVSPDHRVTTETQTRSRKRALRPDKVSSQVQTLGEFSVRAKRAKIEEEGMVSTTETQCSPAKRMKTDLCSVTTMTSLSDVLELSYVSEVSGVQDTDYLWPLRCHTNGTQTSPRMARLPRRISEDEDDEADELSLPSLEPVGGSININKTKLGETRQFSTETQTDLDIFLDNYDDVEKLLTTEMETQTHEGDENLLLLANNYTQTGTEDFLSALMIGSGGESERRQELELGTNTNPFKLDYVCSAETQTRLTGFQDQNLLLQIGNNQVIVYIASLWIM